MLFTAAEEVQKYIPENAEFEFDKLKPFIKFDAEPNLIMPHLGAALYAALDADANAVGHNARMVTLLDVVRYPLANYAYLKYLPWSQVVFGKSGAVRYENADTKSPYEYQIIGIENSCHEAAYNGIEQLLLFLETNKAVSEYASWVTSTAYTYFKELFISTAIEFSSIYNINSSRRTFLALREIMKEVEDSRVQSLISEVFFSELKTQDKAGTLTAENKKVLPFIKRAVANLSIAKACIKIPVKITADGLQLLSTSDRMTIKVQNPADADRINAIIKDCTETGEAYLKQLNDFLYAHEADYPTFTGSDVYVDPESDEAAPFDQSDNGIVGF